MPSVCACPVVPDYDIRPVRLHQRAVIRACVDGLDGLRSREATAQMIKTLGAALAVAIFLVLVGVFAIALTVAIQERNGK